MRPLRTGALLVLLLLLGPALAACTDGAADSRVLVVMGPWLNDENNPDDEHDVFERMLNEYGEQHQLQIAYQGTRAIGQALRARVRAGTLPDIAIMPTAGELATYATEALAVPVTSLVEGRRPQMPDSPADGPVLVDHRALWRGDKAYAVAIKTDLKSLLIHAGSAPVAPSSLAQLRTTADRSDWCLGLSEPSSPAWPGTDWVEDLLLHQANGKEVYRQWASGQWAWTSPEVAGAFREFRDNYVADPQKALLTTPQEAADSLFAGDCSIMHQSSFYAAHEGQFLPFPQGSGVEVSGDFAARFTTDPAADRLLRFLAEGDAWVVESGGLVFPLDPDQNAYKDNRQTVAGTLNTAPARCLDASDAMPPTMAAAFQNAILEYVADDTRLDEILAGLDKVRQKLNDKALDEQFLTVVCSR
jgi:alpha-glucoside transport system substrate-binding protein